MTSRKVSTLMLYDKDGKVLLQHRSKDAKRLPDYWGAFGGVIEAGETPEVALRRELLEELEYRVKNPFLLSVDEWIQGDTEITGYNYVEQYDETQPIAQHEGQGYGWFAISEALQLKMIEQRRNALLKLGEYLEKKGVSGKMR
jgi:8-oxo-dGTP pyrophosphatase MutT (NUDIX family)